MPSIRIVPIALLAFTFAGAPEVAPAGDFANPTAAQLDGSFRNTRLSMEVNRRNIARNGNGGAFGAGIDDYQNAQSYQNVIWVPIYDIGDGNEIYINIGDSQQTATDSSSSASNTSDSTTGGPCTGAILNAEGCMNP